MYLSVVNIYIVYKLKPHVNANTDFTINDCLFGAIKLAKNSDRDKYKYEFVLNQEGPIVLVMNMLKT